MAKSSDLPPTAKPGPRPLAAHFAAANLSFLTSFAASPHWSPASTGSKPTAPELRRTRNRHRPEKPNGEAPDGGARTRSNPALLAPSERRQSPRSLEAATTRLDQLEAMLRGVARYREHAYRRNLSEPAEVWRQGRARILDYGGEPAAPTVLFVPSLVNRGYILDLSTRRSLLRYLSGAGLRPFLLDWGAPGTAERRFRLEDYIAGPLAQALDAVKNLGGAPPTLAGYCMGGTLSVAAASLWPERVGALALLATPWDFHPAANGLTPFFAAARHFLGPALAHFGSLPVDILQLFFIGLDPELSARKFARFADLAPASDEALDFVAIEDWANDGISLAGPVAAECLFEWYGANTPAKGNWRIAGEVVDPCRIACPTLVVVPATDRIVPPAAAAPLARLIPNAEVLEPRAGHIGMVAGAHAEAMLWRPLATWLKKRSSTSKRNQRRQRTA